MDTPTASSTLPSHAPAAPSHAPAAPSVGTNPAASSGATAPSDPPPPRADVLDQLRAHALAAESPDVAAEIVAREAHRNQLDKVGKDYIDHPRRVAHLLKEQGYSPEIVAAGWLHDTIEDTWVTADILGDLGFSEHVVCMVDAMTKREGESSEDYIQRLLDADAVCVKRADLADNTCPIRRSELDRATQIRLNKKYADFTAVLDRMTGHLGTYGEGASEHVCPLVHVPPLHRHFIVELREQRSAVSGENKEL
ncbi:HD domain-containing protein [Schaalia sp. Marseille-Q2122]|uniref:HD domain-containing protein n=1 Tax=Schaalia sp. Marseille-Q2122 TaxID=2736604 RepID=UPI001588E058|nr:HD domain-containing protein [Schaalia sp. Marseille-Q2122]